MLNRIQKAIIDFRQETGKEPSWLYLGKQEYNLFVIDVEKLGYSDFDLFVGTGKIFDAYTEIGKIFDLKITTVANITYFKVA